MVFLCTIGNHMVEEDLRAFARKKGVLRPKQVCIPCERERSRLSMRETRRKDPGIAKRAYQKAKTTDPAKHKYKQIRHSSAERGIEFLISLEDFREIWESRGDCCPICSREYLASDPTHKALASVDRLDPIGPYSKANCWIICKRCNQIKADYTVVMLRQIASAVAAEIRRRAS